MVAGEEWPTDLRWDGHLLLVHATEEERCAQLVAWAKAGLDRGEQVICTDGAEPGGGTLPVLLAEHGVDGAGALAAGRLRMLPLEEFYPPGGQAEAVERALAEGFASVRLSSRTHAALTVLTPQDHQRFELALDVLCRTRPVSALCQYDLVAPGAEALQRNLAIHFGGVRHRLLRTAWEAPGLVLAGEVDLSNAAVLADVLAAAAVANTTDGTLRVELSRLDTICAAGIRALAGGTRDLREAGGRLLLTAPQPAVNRALRLLGLHLLTGVEVTGGEPCPP